jgi:16S rRNA processing protein RimM
MLESGVIVAWVVRPFGRHGEVLAEVMGPDPARLERLRQVWAGPRSLTLLAAKAHQGRVRLSFEGIETIDQAEALRGADLMVPAAQRAELPPGVYYQDDLIGCEVIDRRLGWIGTVGSLQSSGAAELLVVRGPRGELLVPFVNAFLRRLDLGARRIEIDAPTGLVDLSQAETVG